MNSKEVVAFILKGIIWICLGVIMLSTLFVNSHLFFPFIVTKTITFMICVEIMLAAWLVLCVYDAQYRVRLNLTVGLAALYLVILTIASALGNDFYHSFWSNNERSDGILLLLHLFLFTLVLTGFFRKLKEWMYVIDMFIVGSFLVSFDALLQYFITPACAANSSLAYCNNWLLVSSNGARLAATIGNAGYVGGFMVFGIFLAFYMLYKREQIWAKILYGIVIALELFIAVQTQTRGAYLALAFGIGVIALYMLFFYYKNKWCKIAGIIIIVVGLLGVGSVFALKDSSFVKNSPILVRISSIADTGGTANNRIITWGFAVQGFKERPLLGYGQENFYQVFDKYYTTENTEQWFDRAHNMIFDRLLTGGIIGLVSYLALLFLPFVFLWVFYFKKEKENLGKGEAPASKFFTPVIFSILIIAYFIQNMFIFEALAIYIPLFMCLAFAGMYGPQLKGEFLENKNAKYVLAALGVIFCLYGIIVFNIRPLSANMDLIATLASPKMTVQERIDSFESLISRGTYGNQEYRRQYYNFYENVMRSAMQSATPQQLAENKTVLDLISKMETQIKAQLAENPHSAVNYLMAMNFYSSAYVFKPQYLENALAVYAKAKEVSPGRPEIYSTGAIAYYYLGGLYEANKQPALAEQTYAKALEEYYYGANTNVNKGLAFDSFSGFLLSVTSNSGMLAHIKKNGVAGMSYDQFLKKMTEWEQEGNETAETSTIAQREGNLAALKSLLILKSTTTSSTAPAVKKK